MMLTASALKAIMPRSEAPKWAPPLDAAMGEFDLDTVPRMAAFLAQIAHESSELTRLSENLNYSVEGLMKTWPKRFTPLVALKYARQPEMIANYVYAGRNGNGDEASGDGWRYRGRGPIQLTGRANYAKAGKDLGVDLVGVPDAVLAPLVGARVACWFWNNRKLNALADAGDFESITKAINGGLNGYAERQLYFIAAKKVLA